MKSRLAVWVGLVGMLFASIIAIRVLADSDWDVTRFVAFGENAQATRQYGEERLGDIYLRENQGHDGKFFFIQANDPWLLDPTTNASVLDRPIYRSQRMLYPAIVSAGGALSPDKIVWSMLLVNIVAMGIGTWATACLAIELGGSPWLGLAFALNPGFISEMTIDGAGVAAAALAFLAVLLMYRNALNAATFAFSLSALAREAMYLSAIGTAFWLWRQARNRPAMKVAVLPAVALGIWALYARLRLGFDSGIGEVQEFGWPGEGIAAAFSAWLGDPISLAFGLVLIGLMIAFTIRTVASGALIGWAFVGFVPLSFVLTEQVWTSYFDIGRVVAPVITAYVLLLGSARIRDAVAAPEAVE